MENAVCQSAPSDPISRKIADSCIPEATLADLQPLGIGGLQVRLDSLLSRKIITVENGKYRLAIPVVAGEKRDEMMRIVDRAVVRIVPTVVSMNQRLRIALKERQDVLFHILWTRILDALGWKAYKDQFSPDQMPTDLAWIVYPPHPYKVGTNSHNSSGGEFAETWSDSSGADIQSPMSALSDLVMASSGGTVPESIRTVLQNCGCVDSAGRPGLFCYREDDHADDLCDTLKGEYIKALHGVCDYRAEFSEINSPRKKLFTLEP